MVRTSDSGHWGGYAFSVVEGEIETFWEAVKLMAFVYALAAVVSLMVAWVIKLVFSGIQMQKARAESGPKSANDATDRTD